MSKIIFGSKEANDVLERDTGWRFDQHYDDPFMLRYQQDPREVDSEPACHHCGCTMEWEDCWNCGGEGGFDGEYLMEEDPLWYDEDDWERCDVCRGKGGYWMCPNAAQHERDERKEN